ncbi:transposase, partial [Vibrio campbellii]
RCFAYLYKGQPKGRKAHRHSRTCQKHSAGKVFHKGAKEPWLLVTNIPNHVLNGVKITRLYAKRMQIEESFRDLKSPAYGLALRHNRTRCTKRIDILLLMALMAEIIMWWNGLIAMQAKWHYDFQANTIKHRRVLSIPRLGKEVRSHRRYRIKESQYHWAMVEYQRLTHTCGLGEL